MKNLKEQTLKTPWFFAIAIVCVFAAAESFAQQAVNFNGAAVAANQSPVSKRVPINPIDPTTMFVPCTDENKPDPDPSNPSDLAGPPEFGQRRCSTIKPKLKADLKEKIGHIVSYYYDGKLVEFNDKSPVGFCVTQGNIKTPVCEISRPGPAGSAEVERNHHENGPQSCGLRTTPVDSNKDHLCFSSQKQVPDRSGVLFNGIDAAACDAERNAVGMNVLFDKQDQLTKLMEAKAIADANPDDPKLMAEPFKFSPIQFVRQAQIASLPGRISDLQAFLADVSKREDEMQTAWNKFMNDTDGYCTFSKKGFNQLTCTRELAWIRGMRVSAIEEAREQVDREIDSGTLTITSFGQERPCAETALNMLRVLDGDARKIERIGVREAEAQVRKRFGVYTETAALDIKNKTTKEGCLGLEDEVGATPEQAVQKALAALDEAFKNENGNGIESEKKHISVATCNLAFARMQTEAIFSKLAVCEVSMRAKKKFYEESTLASEMFKRITEQVIKPCASYANGTFSIWGCFQSCMTNNFYKCYKGTNEDTRDIPSVSQMLQQVAREKFVQTEAAPNAKIQKAHPERAVASDGSPLNFDNIPNCSALSLIPFAGRARKKYRKNRRRALLALLVTALLVLVSLSSGCAEAEIDDAMGNENDVVCPETHQKSVSGTGVVNRCAATDEACQMQSGTDCSGGGEDPGAPEVGVGNVELASSNVGAVVDIRADDGNSLVKNNPAKKKTNQAQNAATAAFKDGKNGDGNFKVALKNGNTGDGRVGPGFGLKGRGVGNTGAGGGGDSGNSGLSPDGSGFFGKGAKDGEDGNGNGADDANRGLASGDGFGESGANGQGGRGGSGSDFGADGPGGPGGSSDSQLDGYFEKNGKLSLFEVVSRRYGIWSWELERTQKRGGSGGTN